MLYVVFAAAAAAGAIASVGGFGIGSLLTPLFAVWFGTKTAVAAVSIPHLAGTFLRFWTLRRHVDRRVLVSFGVTSAAGGLVGALLHASASSPALAIVLGVLLVVAGIAQLTGHGQRWRFHGVVAWIAGAVSGLFGGLVGNQGGIRSAALLGFDLPKDRFVATATGIALVVDGARMPVYAMAEGRAVAAIWPAVAAATAGVLIGTVAGAPLLKRLPERRFRQCVGALVLILGVTVLFRAAA